MKKLNKNIPHDVKSNMRITSGKQEINKILRGKIYKRDNYQCQYCGSKENLTIDHKIPFSKGGKTIYSNLVTACFKCNQAKSHHEIKYVGEWNRLVNGK